MNGSLSLPSRTPIRRGIVIVINKITVFIRSGGG